MADVKEKTIAISTVAFALTVLLMVITGLTGYKKIALVLGSVLILVCLIVLAWLLFEMVKTAFFDDDNEI